MTRSQIDTRSATLTIIAKALAGQYGQAYADNWLAKQRSEKVEPGVLKAVKTVSSADSRERAVSNTYEPPQPGGKALRAAEDLIGSHWRVRLGLAYPLVLAAVKAALEAGVAPAGKDANSYHCLTTIPTLTILTSALLGRKTCFNQRTLERWLSPQASHAAALRCWLGWKTWYTSTYRDYATGEARCTPGGTVFRVYLKPLRLPNDDRLPAIYPLANHMAKDWRDLELDRRSGRTFGRTYQHAEYASQRVDPKCVGIETKSNREACALIGGVWEEFRNTPEFPGKALLGQQYYIYPDMRSVEGSTTLRNDVDTYATWLAELVTDLKTVDNVINRYREAVWVAVKAELYGDSRRGFELLDRLRRLALELKREDHTLDDPAAWCWKQVEDAGLRELRRDYNYAPGRFYRVMSTRAARKLGIMA